MPNWATNTIEFTATPERLGRVRDAVRTDTSGGEFDFDVLCPMPDELRGSISPMRVLPDLSALTEFASAHHYEVDSAAGTALMVAGRERGTVAMTSATADRLIAMYGATNWYDWRRANWGTKWTGHAPEVLLDEPRRLVVRFGTAWTAPHGLLAHLASQGIASIGVTIHEDGCEVEFLGDESTIAEVFVVEEESVTFGDDSEDTYTIRQVALLH
ncbi:hypothetical protein GOOTI_202_00420 [Gordonia otitidis NBRC 100426]|uniref:YubB ferredoxin-like domain-containing protein n=2 Tax=Gordonia otitidis TaxID=249058 RepID=H5TRS8_GORO1|nr:hypothetical protein GOOTI_202_00420 [Gordonia otitidis NBRC 100426]